ncbi:hypothetical protein MA16_Dca017477 [Dendrobium catenatum]|uniref:Uncharacterized protein n=1 Tax=Dendrobium catenatum TaxID=906689 RepID=A0A2I0WAU5_9ASPA|nr:hypothetical protein MA16_Dca017477 [Dendrobium catenatum]
MEIQCSSNSSADPHIEFACKDLMSMDWDEIPCSTVNETRKYLSKTTNDTSFLKNQDEICVIL